MTVQLAEHTILADRYRVARLLGQGGMGAVYLAADLRFRDAPVAVKQTLVGTHREDLRKAFQREAMLLNHLRHPALPRVTDFFGQEDSEFLVMEFVPGEDLGAALVRRGMPFPVERVALWTDRLLDALAYLHSQTPPVIHRDIKPQNVKLTPDGDVVLLDFGLAKGSVGEQLTTTSSVVAGSPFFAPPEQMGGHGTDERADLYSLAATVYRLLTAALPPDANHRSTCFINGMDDPLRPAYLLNPGVPQALSGVLARALSLRKDDRPTSAVAMRGMWREAIRESLPDVASDLPSVKQYGSGEPDGTLVEPVAGSTIVERLAAQDRKDDIPTPTVPERRLENRERTVVTPIAPGQAREKSGQSKFVVPALAIAGVLVAAGVVAGIWQRWPAAGEQVSVETPEAVASSEPARVELLRYRIERLDGRQLELGEGRFPASTDFRVRIVSAKPGFVYVISVNPDGSHQALVTDRPARDATGVVTNRLETGREFVFPGAGLPMRFRTGSERLLIGFASNRDAVPQELRGDSLQTLAKETVSEIEGSTRKARNAEFEKGPTGWTEFQIVEGESESFHIVDVSEPMRGKP